LTALVLLLLSLTLQGPARTGSIEGFVARAGTDPPFPLVNARLELTGGPENLVTRTDSAGRFVFSGVPPGRFRLRVTKDGYIRQEYPHAAMDAPGLPIDLDSGQQVRNIVFAMDPARTISGAIRDPRNAAVAGVVVQALKRGYDPRGNRTLSLVASEITDDKGSYRLYWLDPGEYFVSAIPSPLPQASGTIPLAPTYFPGFASVDDAKPIRLDSTRDANGTDFALSQQNMGPVHGSAISVTTGRPAVATIVLAAAEDGAGVARFQTRSTAAPPPFERDNYSISNVPPGFYILSAVSGSERAAKRILVRDSPLRGTGLLSDLELGPGVAIHGRLFLASDSAMDLRSARIALANVDTALPAPADAVVAQDGSYAVSAVQPGYYSVSVTGLPGELYLKAAVAAGADLLETALPVAYGGPPDQRELAILIGVDGGRIVGTVVDLGNKPFVGAQVTLIPESNRGSRFDLYRTAISREDGSFLIRGIVPGDYKVFAWANPESNAYLNVEYMRYYENFGTPVHLDPNQSGSLSLRPIYIDR
jgi:Carboxypeptidase regulatory-like domain